MDAHTHQPMHTLALTLANICTVIHTHTVLTLIHWAVGTYPAPLLAFTSTHLHVGEGQELSSSASLPVKPSMAPPQPDQEQEESRQFLRTQIHVPKQTGLERLQKKYGWEKVCDLLTRDLLT